MDWYSIFETIMDLLGIVAIIALVFMKDRSFAFTLKELFGNIFKLRDEEKTDRYSIISLLRNTEASGVPVEGEAPEVEGGKPDIPIDMKFQTLLDNTKQIKE